MLPRVQGTRPGRDALADGEVPEVLREDFVKDIFEDGGVDIGIFQSTYLKEWYTNGFNTAAENAKMAENSPAS